MDSKSSEIGPDILLIYPPLSVSERYGNRNMGKAGGHLPPLGILSIAAVLREKSYSVDVIDSLEKNWESKDILEYIRNKKPKVIGFSAITPVFHRALDCAKKIKAEFPDLLIIIGGHHATILTRNVMEENNCFDIAVFGEGELTAIEFMGAYKSLNYCYDKMLIDYDLLKTIDGIAFRMGNEIMINKEREAIDDLDLLPSPARDLVAIEKYMPLPNQYKRLPIVHMVVTRGCPHRCSFCSNNAIFGKRVRTRSPQKTIEEIKDLIHKYKAKDISFWDDTLTTNKKWMNEFCDLISKDKLDITWTCYSRADSVTKELLSKMAGAGCWNIFFWF